MQNGCMNLLWDFTVQTDKHWTHNRPKLISIDFTRKHAFRLILPSLKIVTSLRRLMRSTNIILTLNLRLQKMWSMKASVVTVILGSIPKCLKHALQLLSIYNVNLIPKLQRSLCITELLSYFMSICAWTLIPTFWKSVDLLSWLFLINNNNLALLKWIHDKCQR